MPTRQIAVESVRTGSGSIESTISCSGGLDRFFGTDRFRVEYDADLRDLPESLATIPVLAHVCPVAWAAGADVSVPVVDATYLDALADVRAELCETYEFVTGGEVRADRVVDGEYGDAFDGTGLLFSGGVDSLASYVRHRDEDPLLVSVQGWTIRSGHDEEWSRLETAITDFAAARDLERRVVRANVREFLNTPMLHAHYKQYLVGSWYSGVGHGLGLLSLCAPLSWTERLGQLYIAATHSPGFDHPWGSTPAIDDAVRWRTTRCAHDGYELTRQEKVELLADYVRERGADLAIHTCNGGTGENCSRCEKCCRTIAGLAMAGLDPNDHGYEVDAGTYERARERLLSGAWVVDEDVRFQWADLRTHAREADRAPESLHDPAAATFRDWLATTDVDEFVTSLDRPLPGRVVQAIARNTPLPVYQRLYPVYTRLKARGSSAE